MLEDVSAVWRQSCCERSHHEIPKRSIHFEITMKGPQDMKKQEWKGVLCESLTDHIHSLCRTPHLAGFSSNGLLQITDFTALSAHPAPSVANESICCMLLQPLKLQMTEKRRMYPSSPLCGNTLVIGPSSAPPVQNAQGFSCLYSYSFTF